MSEDVIVVVGGQFGSESKGHVASYLMKQMPKAACVRVAGPNAGHTCYDAQGRRWAFRHLPVAAVGGGSGQLVIAAGSEIDLAVLQDEIDAVTEAGFSVRDRLIIDSQATVIEPEHQQAEMSIGTGTTGKGIGAARAARLMRQARVFSDMWPGYGLDTATLLRKLLKHVPVLIEGTQGYGLGLHAGYYPYTTSSDCRAIDFLAMAGLSPWDQAVRDVQVWVVMRTHPIRIAGASGPMVGETTWEALGQPPEITTVTKRVRRVGAWDPGLAKAAVSANGGERCRIALMFLDYLFPELAGKTARTDLTLEAWKYIEARQDELGAPVGLVGTGPNSMIDLR